MKAKKHVLITGGAGYIGSHLADTLLCRGYRVFVVDNLSTGKLDNIRHCLDREDYEFLNGNILDADLMDRLVRQADLVFHLAATVGVKHVVEDPLLGVMTNVTGSENVISACWRHMKRVLLASTSEVYGKTQKFPFEEEDDRVLGSTSVHRWSYATAKAIDEHIAFAYADKGLPVSIVRYFNSYGPRIDEKGYGSVVANFTRQALIGEPLTVHGDGAQSRCFTFVEDTVEGTIRAGTKDEAIGRVYNLGTTEETTVLALAHKVIEITGSDSEIIRIPYEEAFGKGFEDTQRRLPCIRRARSELGWEPRIPLEEGLPRTIEWCRKTFSV
jgi:UDP-glucose 4-epimerase